MTREEWFQEHGSDDMLPHAGLTERYATIAEILWNRVIPGRGCRERAESSCRYMTGVLPNGSRSIWISIRSPMPWGWKGGGVK